MKLQKSTRLSSFPITSFTKTFTAIICFLLFGFSQQSFAQTTIGPVNMGHLTDYLFVFTNGSADANWQGATKGFIGKVAVDGLQAKERTSGSVPYSGTIYTNDATLSAWQDIVDDNASQATASYNETSRLSSLQAELENAFTQINSLAATPGYESVVSTSLDGLNTQNGIGQTFVINITSGFSISTQINITGDASDIFILRWDNDANFANGYNGTVKFQSGGAIVPHGGLNAANFVHVAGNISSSGGGTNPAAPYPQGPRTNNGTGGLISGGADFDGGGFFTGFWLTTGSPTIDPGFEVSYGQTSSLSNAIFVGGWYSKTTKFSMTSGTSGVYVAPPPPDDGPPEKRGVNGGVTDDGGVQLTTRNVFNLQAYPNPSIQTTVVRYKLESDGLVAINVYNLAGKLVATLVNGQQDAGDHILLWDVSAYSTGLYVIRMQMGNQRAFDKLIITK